MAAAARASSRHHQSRRHVGHRGTMELAGNLCPYPLDRFSLHAEDRNGSARSANPLDESIIVRCKSLGGLRLSLRALTKGSQFDAGPRDPTVEIDAPPCRPGVVEENLRRAPIGNPAENSK